MCETKKYLRQKNNVSPHIECIVKSTDLQKLKLGVSFRAIDSLVGKKKESRKSRRFTRKFSNVEVLLISGGNMESSNSGTEATTLLLEEKKILTKTLKMIFK